MAAVHYLWEKVTLAVECLAGGEGTFEDRLFNAYISALDRLTSNDPSVEVAEELNWVLLLCKRHLVKGEGRMSEVPEMDRRKIAEKLVWLLIKTSRMTG